MKTKANLSFNVRVILSKQLDANQQSSRKVH